MEYQVQEVGVGKVIGRSFEVFFRNIVTFMVLGMIAYVPSVVLNLLTPPVEDDPGGWIAFTLTTFGSGLLVIVLSFLVTGAVTHGVFQDLVGRKASIEKCLSTALGRLLPIVGVSLLSSLLIGLGSLFFIIPGIILMTMLWVCVPTVVVERAGVIEALQRSSELTKGFRVSIFLIMVVLGILFSVIGAVQVSIQMAISAIPGNELIATIVGLVISGLSMAIWSISSTVGYYLMRASKEGVGVEEVASVFD